MRSKEEVEENLASLEAEMKDLENLMAKLNGQARGSARARAVVREMTRNINCRDTLRWVLNENSSDEINFTSD